VTINSIAVITPIKNETPDCIQRCINTVAEQTHPVALHVMVMDGAQFPASEVTLPQHVHLIHLPSGCEDTGATPRAIGSIYAIAQFCDGIAYLDVDNQWAKEHLQNAVDMNNEGCDVVISDRWICDYDTCEPLYVDDFDHCVSVIDTNTITLFGKAIMTGSQWWQVPRRKGERSAGVDRYIWDRIKSFVKKNNLRIARTHKATSLYNSRWLVHYTRINRTPPKPTKSLVRKDGVFIAVWSE